MFNINTVLVVDDIVENIKVAIGHLKQLNVKTVYATSGIQALKRAKSVNPDLILMDVMMPEMDGFETVSKLKENVDLKKIPIIYLTAKTDIKDMQKGFELGAVDYITKPFNSVELLSRVKTHLELSNYRKNLEKKVIHRTKDIKLLQKSILEVMGSLAEYRDNETGSHIKRTQNYVKAMCIKMKEIGLKKDILTDEYINLLYETCPLHDIGKVGIRDHILLKPGKLTEEEFEIMKKHAEYGEKIISAIVEKSGPTEFLSYAKEIAGAHHEKWDGSGYPKGLKKENIPLSARIMAIADVYDALISKRVYKEGFTHQDAVNIIKKGRGNHFDPELVDVFLKIDDLFFKIAQEHKN